VGGQQGSGKGLQLKGSKTHALMVNIDELRQRGEEERENSGEKTST